MTQSGRTQAYQDFSGPRGIEVDFDDLQRPALRIRSRQARLAQDRGPGLHGRLFMRSMSAATVRAAAHSDNEHRIASAGMTYIAVCRPLARNCGSISVALAACIACDAKWSLNAPISVEPKLAPSTYIATK